LRCAGTDLLADPSGALLWPEQALLVVADLHFETGSSAARRGSLLPPYDTRATLACLEAVCETEWEVAGPTFRHVPAGAPDGPEIAGHLHPSAR
jgi:metallophosphoesterase superfamily enzyme